MTYVWANIGDVRGFEAEPGEEGLGKVKMYKMWWLRNF